MYFENLEEATAFYTDLFDFDIPICSDRLAALNVAGKQVLLLFKREASINEIVLAKDGVIPPHDGTGPVHIAFSIDPNEQDY